jgi:predicted nucleic acid-binding protein
MPAGDADKLMRDLLRLPLKRSAVKRLLRPSIRIGLQQQLAVYDAVYIALAVEKDCPLISVDQAQVRAAALEGVILKPVTDFSK